MILTQSGETEVNSELNQYEQHSQQIINNSYCGL